MSKLFLGNFLLLSLYALANIEPPDTVPPWPVEGITFDFEYDSPADSILPWIPYRDLRNSNVLVVTGRAFSGTHSVQLPLDTMGTKWLLFCRSAWAPAPDAYCDKLSGARAGDTIFYYLYIPYWAPIDSIFMFERDSLWGQDEYTYYFPEDLDVGWNELKDGVSLLKGADTMVFPLVQCDFEIHTDSALNHPGLSPGCTLYLDAIRFSWLSDSSGMIERPKEGPVVLNITKGSINCVEYSLSSAAPVLIKIFDMAGRKMATEVPGIQFEGSHKIYVDLPSGIYLTEITAGKEKRFGKFVSVQ
jgi:hypothetical protein